MSERTLMDKMFDGWRVIIVATSGIDGLSEQEQLTHMCVSYTWQKNTSILTIVSYLGMSTLVDASLDMQSHFTYQSSIQKTLISLGMPTREALDDMVGIIRNCNGIITEYKEVGDDGE